MQKKFIVLLWMKALAFSAPLEDGFTVWAWNQLWSFSLNSVCVTSSRLDKMPFLFQLSTFKLNLESWYMAHFFRPMGVHTQNIKGDSSWTVYSKSVLRNVNLKLVWESNKYQINLFYACHKKLMILLPFCSKQHNDVWRSNSGLLWQALKQVHN